MAKTWPSAACWTPRDALSMINIEAGTPDDANDSTRGDHVFLASHQEPGMRALTEDDFRKRLDGSASSQDQVLAKLEDRARPMVFITGAPGTGKSHLVRWLHLHATTARTSERHASDLFAHVPRSMTNLADVLKVILEHADETEREDLRAKVARATGEAISESALRDRFLLTLSWRLGELRDEVIAQGAAHQFGTYAHLEALKMLPNFLSSGAAKALYRQDGGPADRIVRVRLQDRAEGEDVVDSQLRFTREDILADGRLAAIEDDQFSKDDLTCRAQLLGDGEFLDRSIELIDFCIDGAVRDLVGLDASQLKNAMSRLLESLASRGQRLVLFFEDWGLVAGFQNQLAEAFAAAKGDSVLAVIAITSQRLGQFPGNILQRGWIYSLDRAADSETRRITEDLLARNLNAIRLGPDRLQALFEDRTSGSWVPNACDACPLGVKETCHTAFGTVRIDDIGEVGLFPMTKESITAALLRKSPGELYVPRVVLSDVLRVVLNHETVKDLGSGSFPSSRFSEEFAPALFRLGEIEKGLVRRELSEAGVENQMERWFAFLETYRAKAGDLASHSAGAASALGLHAIAAISAADGPADESSEKSGTNDDRSDTRPLVAPPSSTPSLKPSSRLEGALAFREQRQIANEDALRTAVAVAVRHAMRTDGRMNAGAWGTGPDGFDGNDVGLAAPSRSGRSFEVVLQPEQHADALIGLVHLGDDNAWGQLGLSRDRRLNAERTVDTWADIVERHLLGDRLSHDVAALLRLLLITGIAWGVAPRVTEDNALDVALYPPPAQHRGMVAPDALLDAKARETAQEMLLQRIAYSQGSGGAVAIDLGMLGPILDDVLGDLRLPSAEELPTTTPHDLVAAVKGMGEDLDRRTAGFVSYLQSWWDLNGEDARHLEHLPLLRDVEERLSSQLPLHPAGRSAKVKAALEGLRLLRVEVLELHRVAQKEGHGQLIASIPQQLARLASKPLAEQLSISAEFERVRKLMSSLEGYLRGIRTIGAAVAVWQSADRDGGTTSVGQAVPTPPIERAEVIANWSAGQQGKGKRRGR